MAFLPHLVRRFGLWCVFLLSAAIIYAILPFENLAMVVGGGGDSHAVAIWPLVAHNFADVR